MKTRKLKDLKENECVLMSTLKDVIGISKQVHFNCKKQELVGKYIHRHVDFDHAYSWSDINEGKKELPASDFIKPKKPKKWKEAFQEIARLDGEISELKNIYNVLKQNGSGYDYSSISFDREVKRLESLKSKHSTDCRNLHVKDAEEVKPLEVGKWYKGIDTDYNEAIYCITEINNTKHNGYGFDSIGEWYNECDFGRNDTKLRLATNEEVESALISEAERRGFKEGVKFISPVAGDDFTLSGKLKYYEKYNNLVAYLGAVFCDGKWATIIEQPEEIDWSKPGQLLVDAEGCLALLEKDYDSDNFIGALIISRRDENSFNIKRTTLPKNKFKIKNI